MSAPAKFRKKPVVIEAMQVTFANRDEAAEWCAGKVEASAPSGAVYAPGFVAIETLEGTMWADGGDWIIKGVAGEFYPCKPDIFAATYEPVADSGAVTE